jgi:hypothetical protein
MHVVEIDCDSHENVCGIHRFVRGELIVAEFQSCIGWMQILVETKEKASVSPLTLVSTNNPKPPDAAA